MNIHATKGQSEVAQKRMLKQFGFYAPAIIISIQIIFLFYTNLFCIPKTMDNDTAKLFIHAMEIWKNKTVFIPSWSNQSTLEIDCPLFLAVFIYGICKDIYISFGISNLILAGLAVFVSYKLLKRLDLTANVILYTLAVILIPYSFGQLLYYNMTFFAGGQYAVKVLAPLLLIEALSKKRLSEGSARLDPLLLILLFFGFICSISGGSYVFLTGFLPVMICYAWLILLNKDPARECFKDRGAWICVAVTAVSFIGIVISHIKQVNPSTVNTSIVEISGMVQAFLESFRSYFEMFGAFPYDSVSVMSQQGLLCVLKAVFAIAMLFVILFNIRKCADSYMAADRDSFISSSFVTVIVFNFIIIWFTGRSIEPRYYTSSLIMGLLLAGSALNFLIDKGDSILGRAHMAAIQALLFLGVLVIAVMSDIAVIRGQCYPEMLPENDKLKTLITYIDKNPEKTVIFLDDTDSAEMLRTMDYDSGRLYLAYKTEDDTYNNKGLVANDYYTDLTDALRLDDEHLLIVNDYYTDIERLPVYLLNLYTEADEFQNYKIYRAKANRMDGLSGIAYNDHSRDYCYSDGYTVYDGEISEDGSLYASGEDDYVISSYYLGYYSGSLDIIMRYFGECKNGSGLDVLGTIELWDTDTHEPIASKDIAPSDTDAEIKLQGVALNHQNSVVKVYLKKDCTINIESFDYIIGNELSANT